MIVFQIVTLYFVRPLFNTAKTCNHLLILTFIRNIYKVSLGHFAATKADKKKQTHKILAIFAVYCFIFLQMVSYKTKRN